MSETMNVFGDDPFKGDSFLKEFPDLESTPLVFMATTSSIEGISISECHGMVFGEAAFGVGLGTSIGQAFQSLFGDEAGSSERRFVQVRRQAMYSASEQAKSMGGNAIVGARVDYEFNGTMMFVSVTGTAVTADL